MKKQFTKITTTLLTSIILTLNLQAGNLLAQEIEVDATLPEDSLNNLQNLPWGGDDFPYSKVVKIEDGLNPGYALGYAVFDRHGIDNSKTSSSNNPFETLLGGLSKHPFTNPAPGKEVYISTWVAKVQGCSVEMIIQYAPAIKINPQQIIPTLLEMGIGGRTLRLRPVEGRDPEVYSARYNYRVSNYTYSSILYVARQRFAINGDAAKILMSAPVKEVRAGITLSGNRVLFPIGEKTVERWKTVYSVNPTCEDLTQE